ncbi:hypothetical protein ACFSPU_00810 [Haoranjiania flava]|uniref:Uncharacterized protein n=1 Tax=Haoranjiania flava TaxID=1856322 RepID=A0AAE3IN09_9BACT|nr:hypothetical protein [Haoranjiania flava]MCU7693966.1 hypothetical protein [Haoranjiania flava]
MIIETFGLDGNLANTDLDNVINTLAQKATEHFTAPIIGDQEFLLISRNKDESYDNVLQAIGLGGNDYQVFIYEELFCKNLIDVNTALTEMKKAESFSAEMNKLIVFSKSKNKIIKALKKARVQFPEKYYQYRVNSTITKEEISFLRKLEKNFFKNTEERPYFISQELLHKQENKYLCGYFLDASGDIYFLAFAGSGNKFRSYLLKGNLKHTLQLFKKVQQTNLANLYKAEIISRIQNRNFDDAYFSFGSPERQYLKLINN